MRRYLRLLAAALCSVVILGLCVATAEARGVSRVHGVAKAGQLASAGKVKMKWHSVRGARYQMRVASTKKRLRKAHVISSSNTRAYTPRLVNRKLYFVQVRAVRGGGKGRWSSAKRIRLVKSGGSARTLLRATFNNLPTGRISPANFIKTLGGSTHSTGAYDDTSIVSSPGRGRVIRTKLDAGTMHSTPSGNNGATLFLPLKKRVNQACISYAIRFSKGFDWSLGGKLPGLEGVAPGVSPGTPTGGNRAGNEGWSGRMMWLGPKAYSWAGPTNKAVTYMYNPTQSDNYGDNVRWNKAFIAGKWHSIRVCYSMNSLGRSNGYLLAWMDGKRVIHQTAYRYRTRSDVGVNYLLWHIFRGGGDSSWAGKTTGYVDIDNVTVTSSR
jgi:Polysaccharide lyase 14